MDEEVQLQADLAGRRHWNHVYLDKPVEVAAGWQPRDYDSRTLEHILTKEISQSRAQTILEVGCGNSIWLPYLARKTGARVAGIDYSEPGCELARQRLAVEKVPGKIFCVDLFDAQVPNIGQYDFVFSLGVVEHFTKLDDVLLKLLAFVRPGGTLFTEIPNLRSIHGVLSWIWQPEQLAKHVILRKIDLEAAYERVGLRTIRGHYSGVFSINIVAWPYNPRWPRLAPHVLPWIYRLRRLTNLGLRSVHQYKGIAPIAPFIYVVGQKSAD